MRRGLYGRTQELEWLNMLVGDPVAARRSPRPLPSRALGTLRASVMKVGQHHALAGYEVDGLIVTQGG